MQTLSKMSDKCKQCPHVNDCDNKRMVACAMMELPNISENIIEPTTATLAQPTLKEEHPITINMGEYGKMDTTLEEIKNNLEKELYKSIYCSFNR